VRRPTPRAVSLGVFLLLASRLPAQSPHVLYTWSGTTNVQGWVQAFGDNALVLENSTAGELTVTETGAPGAAAAFSDEANIISEGGPTIGGLDLTGLSALEFDLGHSGDEEVQVNVQFFVQATPAFTYRALGPDQPVGAGVRTYTAPLGDLTAEEIAYIRVIGVNIREHLEVGNLTWTLAEVRSAGMPLGLRDYATHEPGTSDNGLQGAIVNFDNGAVEGNDGGQNQTGLVHNTEDMPPGNTGSLRWVDLATGNGAAVTWHNGTVWGGNTFNERPTDMSNYTSVFIRMAATNRAEGFVESVGVQYFLQTGNFNFFQAGPIQQLPADGEFHDLEFPIRAVPRLDFVPAHGINLQNHAGSDLIIDVDNLRAVRAGTFTDCNQNGFPDEGDLADGRSRDCNLSGIPDECDISAGASEDCNQNGVPDECDVAGDAVTRVLYSWEGTDNVRGWMRLFGDNEAVLDNAIEGELTVQEIGAEGRGVAISDAFNVIDEASAAFAPAPGYNGIDLTGMERLEFELGHSGQGPVVVQFFVQATSAFEYVALGPDQEIQPGLAVYTAPLGVLNRAQIAHLRTIGINGRDHLGEGNLIWTLREVRVAGVPLSRRDFATHEPGSSDNGLQGAVVSGDHAAVEGNDGMSNQTGLRHNTSNAPPGNSGSLQWTDLAESNGGAVSWFNGTTFQNLLTGELPTDMAAYGQVAVRLAATNLRGGEVQSVDVQYGLTTAGLNFHPAGPPQALAADGEFHELVFPIAEIPGRAYVEAHTLDLGVHLNGDLQIDIDRVRAVSTAETANDCNANSIPDDCEIAAGVLHDVNQNGEPDECEEALFRRADVSLDADVNIGDPIRIFGYLFLGASTPGCLDAADADDDGEISITDGIFTLNFLFLGGRAIPAPGFEACGVDPTADGLPPCDYPASFCR
jgi:hypothetical protein